VISDTIDHGVLPPPHEHLAAADALDGLPIVILEEDGRPFAELFECGIRGADGDVSALGILEADQEIGHGKKGWREPIRVSSPVAWFVILPGALTARVLADTVLDGTTSEMLAVFLLRGKPVARFSGVAGFGREEYRVKGGAQ
jgi:hypothetical protein